MKTFSFFKTPAMNLQETEKSIILFLILLLPLLIISNGIQLTNRLFAQFLMLFSGWLTWTFIEYFNHRFRMHGKGNKKKVVGYQRHIHHHHHPTDLKITGQQRGFLLMGNLMLFILCIFYKNWIFMATGLYTGFVIYTLMHWFLHTKFSTTIFPEVSKFHIHHHCKHPDKCFGITVTWWDHFFDTIPHQQTEITERIKTFYFKKEQETFTQ